MHVLCKFRSTLRSRFLPELNETAIYVVEFGINDTHHSL